MGGIIAGFLGGASAAMADAGKMMLADKLAKEREEANFLRESELRKAMQSDRFAHEEAMTTSEIQSREVIAAEDRKGREKVAGIGAKARIDAANIKAQATRDSASKSNSTTNERDAAALMAQGYPKDVANAIAYGALKEIKDESTGEMVLINALTNTPVGRLTYTQSGKGEWVEEGKELPNARVEKKHRAAAAEAASKKAGWTTSDKEDFPETGGDRKAWEKQEAQRLANEERESKRQAGSGQGPAQDSPGLVGRQMPGQEVKTINGREMNKQQFIEAMVARYGRDKMAQIEETWNSIK